jgi:hypothetical protein
MYEREQDSNKENSYQLSWLHHYTPAMNRERVPSNSLTSEITCQDSLSNPLALRDFRVYSCESTGLSVGSTEASVSTCPLCPLEPLEAPTTARAYSG